MKKYLYIIVAIILMSTSCSDKINSYQGADYFIVKSKTLNSIKIQNRKYRYTFLSYYKISLGYNRNSKTSYPLYFYSDENYQVGDTLKLRK